MVGDVQILGPEDLARYRGDAYRRGLHVDARQRDGAAPGISDVRTFATVEDLDEAKSRLYLGLPLVRDREAS